jgi:serine/threonine protein kinase
MYQAGFGEQWAACFQEGLTVDTSVPSGVLPPLPGDPAAVGPYQVLGRLGVGGMGVVYLARDTSGELIAVKTLRRSISDDPESRLRFHAEVVYGRRVSSSWTPSVLADGTDRSQPYIVTEYIPGSSLSEWVLTQGPLDGDLLNAVALGMAAALAAVHRAGLVHRDLKPANVLLSPAGPRVIDFGIANDLDAPGGFTQQGMVMGSPGWVAPERFEGRPATPASDVFSWGCVTGFAALGRHPFGSGGPAQILQGYPELASLEEPLRGLVMLSLGRDPAARPRADELLMLLLASHGRDSATEAVAALWTPSHDRADDPDGPTSPLPRRRRRAGLAALAVAAAAGAIVAIVGLTSAATPDLTRPGGTHGGRIPSHSSPGRSPRTGSGTAPPRGPVSHPLAQLPGSAQSPSAQVTVTVSPATAASPATPASSSATPTTQTPIGRPKHGKKSHPPRGPHGSGS